MDGRKPEHGSGKPGAESEEPMPTPPAKDQEPGLDAEAPPLDSETAKPTGRTPIPHIYPRPRVSSKTPPEGLYRYEPKKSLAVGEPLKDQGKERPQSYSSIPTARDIKKPKLPPGTDKENEKE